MGGAFVFDEKARRGVVPKGKMLANLKRFIGARPAGKRRLCDYDAWKGRLCRATTMARHFGGWRRALWTAGDTTARRGKYTPADLIAILEDVWRKVERPPGATVL